MPPARLVRSALHRTGIAVVMLGCAVAHVHAAALPLAVVLKPGETTLFHVDGRHAQVFALCVHKGAYVRIRFEQLHNLALVTVDRPAAAPETRFRDTGRHGIIRITLVANQSGTERFVIHPYESGQSASGLVRVSAVRRADVADRLDAVAEARYARAEWSRHRGAAPSWPRALREYRSAVVIARRLHDTTLERAALTGEARLEIYRLNGYAAALPLAREAVALPPGRDLTGEALAWKTLSSAQYFLAQYPQFIHATDRALDLYRRTGDRYWQGILLGNLAYVYRETGRTGLALATARRSLAIARSIHDGYGVDFNLEALGDFHLARGELDQAFLEYRRALAALRVHPYPYESEKVWRGLGELFDVAHEPRAARAALRKALTYAERAHDAAGALALFAHLGRVSQRLGNARVALQYYQQGIKQADALHLPRDEALLLSGLGHLLAASGRAGRARSTYHRAITLAAQISAPSIEAAAWQGLGDSRAAAGRLAAAQSAYRRAFYLWSRESDRVRMAAALASLARLDDRQGHLARAYRRIEHALTLIETSRESLTSRQLRTSYFASQHAYYALGISILMALDHRFSHSDDAERALQMAERARARTLLDELGRTHRLPAALIPRYLAQALHRNQAQVQAAYAHWRVLVQDPSATDSQFRALQARIATLLRSGDALDALARARSERYAVLTSAHPARLARIRRMMAPSSAMIEYWTGASGGYAWLIRRSGISWRALPARRVLVREVRAWRRAVTARSRSVAGESVQRRLARIHRADRRAEQLAQRLGRQLLPACSVVGSLRVLYVVPDGPLFGVAFAALHARGCTSALVRTAAVLEEPSASVLLSLARRGTASPLPARALSVAVLADPVYSRRDPRFGGVLARSDGPPSRTDAVRFAAEESVAHLPRLVGSRQEALTVERLSAPGHALVRMGFAATAQAVRTLHWRRFQVVDFAVHTLLNVDHPDFSGLVLSMYRPNGAPQDGVLWLRDIYGLHIPVDLIVLSGCRTLGGRDVPGEGLVGLSRAFLMAGAQAVLGSLWRVEDRATSRLMSAFYRNLLRRHLQPAQALREAQLSFARSKRYSAPYYWAGFSIEGEGARLR